MKTILVATDFSEIANNAVDYAVEIAKVMKARLILFHVCQVPVVLIDAMVISPSVEDLKQISITALKETKNNIQLKHGEKIDIVYKCEEGQVVNEINLYTNTNQVDMVVIGMHGAGYLSEKLIGSVTTSLLHESNCPVMAIDQKVRFRALKKIVLACDYKQIKRKTLEPLKEIANLFNAHIYILNVLHKLGIMTDTVEGAVCELTLDNSFDTIDHTFHTITNESSVDGINNYVLKEQMDMVVMIPRESSFLKQLFNKSHTKQMAFHTYLPLLVLQEPSSQKHNYIS